MEYLHQNTTDIAIQSLQKEDNCVIDLFNFMVAYPIYPWIGRQYKIDDPSNNLLYIIHQSATVISIYGTTKCTTFINTMVIQYRVHLGYDRLTKCFRILILLSFILKSILGLCQDVLAYYDVFLQRYLLFFTWSNLKRSIYCWFTSRVSIWSICCRKSFIHPQW